MATLTATIWVCIDCYATAANGDPHPLTGEYINGIYRETYDYGPPTLGRLHGVEDADYGDCDTDHGEDYDAITACETQDFSWSRCELCRSTLGGSRHAMTIWFSEPSLDSALPATGGYDKTFGGVVAGG